MLVQFHLVVQILQHGYHDPNQVYYVYNSQPYNSIYDQNGRVLLCSEYGRTIPRRPSNQSRNETPITKLITQGNAYGPYYDQKIEYFLEKQVETEQSVAAAYYSYVLRDVQSSLFFCVFYEVFRFL